MRVMLAAALVVSSVGLAWAAMPVKHDRKPASQAMTELKFRDVIPLSSFHQAAVILSPEGGEVVVPVLVGEAEGQALSAQLKDSSGDRAQSLRNLLKGAGGKVLRVELTEVEGDSVKAQVIIDRNGHSVTIAGEAAPSLSVALASGAPVMASKAVMDGLGLTRSQIRDLVNNAPGGDSDVDSDGGPSPDEEDHPSGAGTGTISL